MAPAYRCRLSDFGSTSSAEKLGFLIAAAASAGFATHHTKQTEAWRREIELLGNVAGRLLSTTPPSRDWWLLLEYEIPRRGKRPDAILLADELIFVIEFKVGADKFSSEDEWQVVSYALDLRDFHLGSQERTILPILVATEARVDQAPLLLETLANANLVAPLQRTGGNGGGALAACVVASYQRFHNIVHAPVDGRAGRRQRIGPPQGSSRRRNGSSPATASGKSPMHSHTTSTSPRPQLGKRLSNPRLGTLARYALLQAFPGRERH